MDKIKSIFKKSFSFVASPFVYMGSMATQKPHKHVPMTKLASKVEVKEDVHAIHIRELVWGLIMACSCGLGGWALKSTVDLYADSKEERALRSSTDERIDKTVESNKTDSDKALAELRFEMNKKLMEYKQESAQHLAEYKVETEHRLQESKADMDRRFAEIQKQLELMNQKLDSLLLRKTP